MGAWEDEMMNVGTDVEIVGTKWTNLVGARGKIVAISDECPMRSAHDECDHGQWHVVCVDGNELPFLAHELRQVSGTSRAHVEAT